METYSLTSSNLLNHIFATIMSISFDFDVLIYNLGHWDPRMGMYRILRQGYNLHLMTECGMEQ